MELNCLHLSKSYGSTLALNDLSFRFTPGVYALLGPNGSGKTTFMNLLVRNLVPDTGEILWNGTPISALKTAYFGHIGYMPQYSGLYPHFTVQRFLLYMAELKDLYSDLPKREALARRSEEIHELLEKLELSDRTGSRIRTLSGGMRQRLMLAQALLGRPDLVILDEPTAGLDPKQRILVRNLIAGMSRDRIVILATHLVADVAPVVNQVLFLRKGNLVGQGTPGERIDDLRGRVWTIHMDSEAMDPDESEGPYRQFVSLLPEEDGNGFRARVISGDPPAPDARPETPTLEDVYLSFFGSEPAKKKDMPGHTTEGPDTGT